MSLKIVVLEVDGHHIRGGYAGDHVPRFEISCEKLLQGQVQVLEAFRHIFFNLLLTKPKDCNVLLIIDTLVQQSSQNYMVTALLKDIQVNSVSLQSKFYMAMLASGLSAGIIVSVGESSYCYAFADCRPIVSSLRWVDFSKSAIEDSYVVDADEVAFQLLECLKSVNSEVRQSVSRGIVVCGSGSQMSGLSQSITEKASQMAVSDPHFESSLSKVLQKLPNQQLMPVVSPFHSVLMSWIGGSLFASLSSNQKSFLKIGQFRRSEENGESILMAPENMTLLMTSW